MQAEILAETLEQSYLGKCPIPSEAEQEYDIGCILSLNNASVIVLLKLIDNGTILYGINMKF